ncbi:MAG: hypothetical protein ACQEP1_00160 [Nanobdellota archaeon]
MGQKFNVDGDCWECGEITQRVCDGCGRFICDDHTYSMKCKGEGLTVYEVCKECKKKGKVKNPKENRIRRRHGLVDT